jgi:hypothetical protein
MHTYRFGKKIKPPPSTIAIKHQIRDQKLKEAFFELQRHWQFLARSYDPATVLSCWTASNIWRSVNYEAEAG